MTGIGAFPRMLSWNDESDALGESLHRSYYERMLDLLGAAVARCSILDAGAAHRALAALRALDDAALERLALAPETTARLTRRESDGSTLDFLEMSAAAELRRSGRPVAYAGECISALGDYRWTAQGFGKSSDLRCGIPLDVDSPYAAAVDMSGLDRDPVPPRPLYSSDEGRKVVEKIDTAFEAIAACSGPAAAFVRRFTKVIVAQADPERPAEFSSGSNGYYIGRTFLANAERDHVEVERLADALVHEAVHSALYMDELAVPWVTRELRNASPQVTSPWSGRALGIRQFLQACFVWYALVSFWAQAILTGAFNRRNAGAMLARASKGFHDALIPRLAPWESSIEPQVLAAVRTMRSFVARAAGVAIV